MSSHKYPYVPKKYYPAVMFACKMIREHGQFNRAIQTSAGYYKVDEDTLIEYVRERQSAGQKGQTRGSYRNYRFKGKYVIYHLDDDQGYEPNIPFDYTIKALNHRNAKKKLDELIMSRQDRYYFTYRTTFEIDGDEVSDEQGK